MFRLFLFLAIVILAPLGPDSAKANKETSGIVGENKEKKGFFNQQQEVAFRAGGQLESFSSHATGLGDLEAQEELKKMNKRSISREVKRRKGLLFEPEVGLGLMRKRSTSPLRLTRSLLQNKLASNVNYEPILVARRTNGREDLIDGTLLDFEPDFEEEANRNNQQEQQAQEEFVEPAVGEYDSGVSLLTTRKMQPQQQQAFNELILNANRKRAQWEQEKQLLYNNLNKRRKPSMAILDKLPLVESRLFPLQADLVSEPRVIERALEMFVHRDSRSKNQKNQQEIDLDGDEDGAEWLKSNYLPRIARSQSYMRRR